jgi:hypothetical protein
VFEDLAKVKPCCVPPSDGFTLPLLAAFPGEQLKGEEARVFVEDCFGNCPDNNIPSEYRFARARKHNVTNQGRPPDAATLSSNHMLSEWKAQYNGAVGRLRLMCIVCVG